MYLLNKYLKCSVWWLALRYDIYIYVVRLQKVNVIHTSCIKRRICALQKVVIGYNFYPETILVWCSFITKWKLNIV